MITDKSLPYPHLKPEEYVVFCCTDFQADTIADFLNEFYATPENKNVKVLVLNVQEQTNEIRETIQTLAYENNVYSQNIRYFQGSAIKKEDLMNISIKKAKACFIMTHRVAVNIEQEDQRTIMRAMHIKRFAPSVKLFVHVLRIKSKLHVEFADQIICDEELNHAMFALNSRIPGCSTAMILLCHTTQETNIDEDQIDTWQKHINNSVDFEIYDTVVSKSRIFSYYVNSNINWSFAHLSYDCYLMTGINAIAVSRNNQIKINPGSNFVLRGSDVIYYISGQDENEIDAQLIDKIYEKRRSNMQLNQNHELNQVESSVIYMTEENLDQISNISETFDSENEISNQSSAHGLDMVDMNSRYIIDFPRFCPVTERTALHVFCYLNNNPAKDIEDIKKNSFLRSEVFTSGKKLHKPIIIINDYEFNNSLFKGFLNERDFFTNRQLQTGKKGYEFSYKMTVSRPRQKIENESLFIPDPNSEIPTRLFSKSKVV